MSTTFTVSEHADYLERYFDRLWTAASGLLKDNAIHALGAQLPDICRPVHAATADFRRAPRVTTVGDSISLRLPSQGALRLELALANDFSASADISATTVLGSGTPTWHPSVNVDVGLPWWVHVGGVLVGGLSSVAITAIITEVIEDVLSGIVSGPGGALRAGLDGWLGALVYDRSTPLQPADAGLELRTPADHQTSVGTTVGTAADTWLDLVLVADGYAEGELPAFDAAATDIVTGLLATHRRDNAFLRHVASTVRIHTLRLHGNASAERIAVSAANTRGRRVAALSNLARLAEVGLKIETDIRTLNGTTAASSAPPIIVVLTNTTGAAISLANVILLPVPAGGTGHGSVATVLHELGHTIGGLGDEYSCQDRNTCNANDAYRGVEPTPVNVTMFPPSTNKWAGLMGAVPVDPGVQGEEHRVTPFNVGAYEYSTLFRPARECKMRRSGADVPFCPVCERTMAEGTATWLGDRRPAARTPLTVEIEYESPWSQAPQRYTVATPLNDGDLPQIDLPVAPARNDGPTLTTTALVRVVRSGVPDPVPTIVLENGAATRTERVSVVPGDEVTLVVRPGQQTAVRDAVRDRLVQRVKLRFVLAPNVTVDAPTGLAQTPAVGASTRQQLDQPTGALVTDVVLRATAGDPGRQVTETVFHVQPEDGTTQTLARPDRPGRDTVHEIVLERLAPGSYTWSARRRLRGTGAAVFASDDVTLPRRGRRPHYSVLAYRPSVVRGLPAPFELVVRSVLEVSRPAEVLAHMVGRPLEPIRDGLVGPLPSVAPPAPRKMLRPEKLAVLAGALRSRAAQAGRAGGGLPFPLDLPDLPDLRDVPGIPDLPGVPDLGELVDEADIAELAAGLPTVLEVALSADAYHPGGGPLVFEFQFAAKDGSFAPDGGATRTDPLRPTAATTLRVRGTRPLGWRSSQALLSRAWRVRTTDSAGLTSPWVESRPPHQSATRIVAP